MADFTPGRAGTGGAEGTGSAALKGGSGNAAPTKTPIKYRDFSTWDSPAIVLYSQVT